MPVLRNIGLLATCASGGGQGEVHEVAEAALAWEGGRLGGRGPRPTFPQPGAGPNPSTPAAD
ncbi:hypothetical protein BH24GEM1_BH24GEM1_20400 [soil metagenome]